MLNEKEIREEIEIHKDALSSKVLEDFPDYEALQLVHEIAVMALEGVIGDAPTLSDLLFNRACGEIKVILNKASALEKFKKKTNITIQ